MVRVCAPAHLDGRIAAGWLVVAELLILERRRARVLAAAVEKDNHGKSQAFRLIP